MSGTSSALEPEWSLLRVACSEDDSQKKPESLLGLLRQPMRWEVLWDLADRHGVQPLLSQALLSVGDSITPELRDPLRQSFQTNLHKALLLSRELIQIVDHLSTLRIEVMPYKGPVLAELAYGDIALRQAGDIDLMILAADLPRIRVAVRELGYIPHAPLSEAEEQAYLRCGYELAFDGTAGTNLLEVQWAIQPWFYAVDFDMAGLFQRAVATTVAGYPVKTPGFEDLFVVLALHAAKHVWTRLMWICDLARMMSRPGLNWKRIGSLGTELGVTRILRVSMLLANRLLSVPIPAAAEASLPSDSGAFALANEIQGYIVSDAVYDVESLAYFRLMLRLRERSRDRVRFLSRLALTPGPGEWAAVRLPQRLFPLYRVVRIFRVAARLVRTQA